MIIFEKHGLENEEFFRAFPFTICEFPQHFHRAFELIFVIKGEISVSIDLIFLSKYMTYNVLFGISSLFGNK